jgi:hypothetical protein
MIVDGDHGVIGGMRIGRGNRSTQTNPAPEPISPPQIPHDQTQAQMPYDSILTKYSILVGSFFCRM